MIAAAESVSLAFVDDTRAQSITADATLTVEDDRTLAADRDALVRLLTTLFENVVEHGGHDVRIRVDTTDDGFYVEDDGRGLPDDPTIFDARPSPGARDGVGVAIVQRLAEAHDWTVEAGTGASGGARVDIVTEGEST